MHITLESDYAIRIVDYLSHQTEKKSAAQIAEDSSVPQRLPLKFSQNSPRATSLNPLRAQRAAIFWQRSPEKSPCALLSRRWRGLMCSAAVFIRDTSAQGATDRAVAASSRCLTRFRPTCEKNLIPLRSRMIKNCLPFFRGRRFLLCRRLLTCNKSILKG